jgi:hypothetical protein
MAKGETSKIELHFTRTLRGLEPADEEAREAMKAWKIGGDIKGAFTVTRSNARLRWYWKLCQIVADNSDHFTSRDEVSDTIKLGCGVVEQTQVYENGQWRIERKPGSIALRNMKDPDFRAFEVRAQAFVCSMLDVTNEELMDALESYLNPDSRRAA